jgi:riboflavin synthase
VDGTAEVIALEALGDDNWWLRLRLPDGLERYFVEKGSIAVDGISLTIAGIEGRDVAITIIPHTYEHTALSSRRAGDRLNIEVDVIAKHVERLLQRQ